MKRRVVIPRDHFPVRFPVWTSLLVWMALDFYRAPDWLRGAVAVVFLIVWVVSIVMFFIEKLKPIPGYGDEP